MGFNSQGAGAQSRAGFTTKKASGGGAGPTLTARLDIGPDFGENAKGEDNDDETWTAGAALLQEYAVELTGDAGLGLVHPGLTELLLTNDAVLGLAEDMPQLAIEGDLSVGLESGASTFNPSGYAEHNYLRIPYLHYMKSVVNDNYGFIVLQQDGSTSPIGAIAVKGSNQYLFNRDDSGTTGQFSIWPEAVAGVSGDEKRAYWKFPTNQLRTTGGGDLLPIDGIPLVFLVRASNPAVATDAEITFNLFTTTANPWDNTSYTYDANGGWFSDTANDRATRTATLEAGADKIIGFTVSSAITNVLDNNWLWIEAISDLPELIGPVAFHPFHASGQPNDYIGDYQAGVVDISVTMWQT